MKVLIIGKGIVGASTGAMLETKGYEVIYHDPPKGIVAGEEGRDPDVALICVGTPIGASGGLNDAVVVEEFRAVISDIWPRMIGIRSTMTIAATAACGLLLEPREPAYKTPWFLWPEFLKAKYATIDAARPSRTVIGWGGPGDALSGDNRATIEALLPATDGPTVWTSAAGAAFIKLATNAIHAVNVGLANDLAAYAASYGLDWNALVPPLAEGSNTIPSNIRVTLEGGYGGACLPKDVAEIVHDARARSVSVPTLQATHEANLLRRPIEYAPA